MFSHISNSKPSICIEDLPIKDIIENGNAPLEMYKNKWTNENFINKINKIMNKLIKE